MNINSILNTTRPISLYEKEKDTRDTSFLDVLAQNAKEAYAQMAARSADAAQSTETASSKNQQPRYTLTDEEAEYFREKYGENYDEETIADFFYELFEKGIISLSDASEASGRSASRSVEIVGAPPGVDPVKWAAIPLWAADRGITPQEWLASRGVKLVSGELGYPKSRNILPYEYEDFKRDYNKDVVTWEDFIQEQRDFYEYMKNRDTAYDAERNPRPNNPLVGYDERLEGVERAAEVIKQIFG